MFSCSIENVLYKKSIEFFINFLIPYLPLLAFLHFSQTRMNRILLFSSSFHIVPFFVSYGTAFAISQPVCTFHFPRSFFRAQKKDRKAVLSLFPYSMIPVTTPAPTVLPPSRIANRNPSSIAICVISLIVICTLSPGITISTPSGNSITPVTSVVLK